ncbi:MULTISPECIES: NUDIX domain-containing protein [unclassified Sphingomonas]|jgi:8-oxo-dGTP pyrophosphatase MutT (NUDIX family)|uniref:DNA mismatch repair protein MutT n=2 Tax=Sphingomonas hankookensis TaxID=563996 RepID=A0ABR5YGF0_9SPHN|nr:MULTISPECIES: NUDIX domain-containing protein [unclassified Sphingomonas]KZE18054.1 DNA mismatch repair protein MutT [Sphingomonas hankookensis]PZT93488.1 MAG: NUDIX domain-containing protein [Sphingomonas sp.]RSV32022.1 NUDIX domain-containing protein [Sphingomonas sp. ABOLH]
MADPDMIRIAAALIEDGNGRMLLVRKAGTRWFMQAGGKIETGEQPVDALCRELHEELDLVVDRAAVAFLGHFAAPAANEAGRMVHAELFHVRSTDDPAPRLEIEEALWVDRAAAETMPLAPLTRDHVLPIFARLTTSA